MVNGKQRSVWFVPTGMSGLPQNVLLNLAMSLLDIKILTLFFLRIINEFLNFIIHFNNNIDLARAKSEAPLNKFII